MSVFEIVHDDDVGQADLFRPAIFKGHLLALYHPGGMAAFLQTQGVKLVGWKSYVGQD